MHYIYYNNFSSFPQALRRVYANKLYVNFVVFLRRKNNGGRAGWCGCFRRNVIHIRSAEFARVNIMDNRARFFAFSIAGDFSTSASPALEMTLCTFWFLIPFRPKR